MLTKTTIVEFFSKTKVIFATIAAVITFSITLYNQFKSNKTTEISGFVTASKDMIVPVDAVVKIISPIQSQTETDSKGRFKFKLENIQSDTFLLVVQNKRTNLETKQNEYISAGSGRKDIIVLFNANIDTGRMYTPFGKIGNSGSGRRKPDIIKVLQGIHLPRRR